MATQRKNFEVALEKARLSEALVSTLLYDDGYQVYRPQFPGRAPIDILATPIKKIDDDVSPTAVSFYIDVKCQPARSAYGDQGINEANLNEYLKWEATSKMRVLLFFVDEDAGCIYVTKSPLHKVLRPTEYNGKNYPAKEPKYSDPNSIVVYIDPRKLYTYRTIHPLTIEKLKALRTTDFIGG